jgi:hypothetical protein
MLLLSCLSFRAHNPTADLLVLDIDAALTVAELVTIRRFTRVHTGPSSPLTGETVVWTHSNLDKTLALAHSPFDETCQIDLDLLWTGPASDVWDTGRAELTLCHYDLYHATWTNVSAGVVVSRDRAAMTRVWNHRSRLEPFCGWAAQADEVLVREAWYMGTVTVDLMPGELWEMDWQAWFPGQTQARVRWPQAWPPTKPPSGHAYGGALCSWSAPLAEDWGEATPIDRVFHCGDLYPRSFHFCGNKARILACPRADRYRQKLIRAMR